MSDITEGQYSQTGAVGPSEAAPPAETENVATVES